MEIVDWLYLVFSSLHLFILAYLIFTQSWIRKNLENTNPYHYYRLYIGVSLKYLQWNAPKYLVFSRVQINPH